MTKGTNINKRQTTMTKTSLWCGYLEAGNKSSAVLRDDRLETGNPRTLFLYNLARDEILQYSRELVEPKLRELRDDEADLTTELKNAYAKARRTFKFHTEGVLAAPTRKQSKGANERRPLEREDAYTAGPEFEDVGEEEWVDEDE